MLFKKTILKHSLFIIPKNKNLNIFLNIWAFIKIQYIIDVNVKNRNEGFI